MSDNQRRKLLRALAAAGLFGGGISGLISRALANGDDPIAVGLHKVKGSVSVNGQNAQAGMLIKAGDTIVTGPASEAIYVIGDNAFLQRDNSSVIFGDAASDFFRLVTGKLLSVFGKGQKRLVLGTATIGIRGTGCYVESTKTETYFCLCYGTADVVPAAAPEQRELIETTHHEHPITITADASAGSIMKAAPVINHTDVELVLLESLVGRRPPFHGSGSGSGSAY